MKRDISRRQFLSYVGAGSAAALLAACAPTPTPAPTAKPEPTQASQPVATAVPPPTVVPATKQPLTISYWVELNSNVGATLKSYAEMTCYNELEKRTGVKVEFQHPPTGSAQAKEQFSLIVASGKYPDVIEFGWLSAPGGPGKYIKEKIIHKLNDTIDKQAPNLKKVLGDHVDWKKQVTTDDGEMFVFPFLRGDPYLLTFFGPVVRGDWLEKLKIQPPKTFDDWHAMLVAFKQGDPNGNGKGDEIPFSINRAGGKHTGLSSSQLFLGASGVAWEWYQDKGTAKYGPMQPEFKELLKLLSAWFKEGLIDPEYISADKAAMDAKVTGHLLGAHCNYAGSGIGNYMGAMAAKDPNFKLIGLPYPVAKAGDKPLLGQIDNVFTGMGAAITTACKRVDDVAAWLDYAYGPEGHLLFNFGLEGLSYNMVNGYPTYSDLLMKNPNGLPVNQAMGQHARSNHHGPFVQDRRYMEQYSALPEQKAAISTWMEPSNENAMPPVSPTQDESKKFATVMNDVKTRFEEAFDQIITGAQPVGSWDDVLGQFKQMGIEDAIKIQQAALERYNKR